MAAQTVARIAVDWDGIDRQAGDAVMSLMDRTQAGSPEQNALQALMVRYQEATDAMGEIVRTINGALEAAEVGPDYLRNRLAKAVNGEGFGGIY